ncbi:hypothetical protein ACJBU6_07274 [Exserohilum turcicum]
MLRQLLQPQVICPQMQSYCRRPQEWTFSQWPPSSRSILASVPDLSRSPLALTLPPSDEPTTLRLRASHGHLRLCTLFLLCVFCVFALSGLFSPIVTFLLYPKHAQLPSKLPPLLPSLFW